MKKIILSLSLFTPLLILTLEREEDLFKITVGLQQVSRTIEDSPVVKNLSADKRAQFLAFHNKMIKQHETNRAGKEKMTCALSLGNITKFYAKYNQHLELFLNSHVYQWNKAAAKAEFLGTLRTISGDRAARESFLHNLQMSNEYVYCDNFVDEDETVGAIILGTHDSAIMDRLILSKIN